MQLVREGSHDAVWEIIDRFGWQIQKVIRRHLNASLRAQFRFSGFYAASLDIFLSLARRSTTVSHRRAISPRIL